MFFVGDADANFQHLKKFQKVIAEIIKTDKEAF
jgi:hypothetical protein